MGDGMDILGLIRFQGERRYLFARLAFGAKRAIATSARACVWVNDTSVRTTMKRRRRSCVDVRRRRVRRRRRWMMFKGCLISTD